MCDVRLQAVGSLGRQYASALAEEQKGMCRNVCAQTH
jgi:hypothetical protein